MKYKIKLNKAHRVKIPIKIILLKNCNPSCPLYKRKEKDTVQYEQLSNFKLGDVIVMPLSID